MIKGVGVEGEGWAGDTKPPAAGSREGVQMAFKKREMKTQRKKNLPERRIQKELTQKKDCYGFKKGGKKK